MVMMSGGSTTEIIQMCEVTVLCVGTATCTATYIDNGRKSKPVPCCDAHKALARERAEHLHVDIEFTPIPGAKLS